jgi:hypothetical protein
MEDKRLLEVYVKEVISEIRFDRSKKNWFSQLLKRNLDSVGKAMSQFLSAKLDKFLPSDLLDKLSAGSTDDLSRVVSKWIEDAEEFSEKNIDKKTKEEIMEYAARIYARALKKYSDAKKALMATKSSLDVKYASLKY